MWSYDKKTEKEKTCFFSLKLLRNYTTLHKDQRSERERERDCESKMDAPAEGAAARVQRRSMFGEIPVRSRSRIRMPRKAPSNPI